jgi:hypothetical protein
MTAVTKQAATVPRTASPRFAYFNALWLGAGKEVKKHAKATRTKRVGSRSLRLVFVFLFILLELIMRRLRKWRQSGLALGDSNHISGQEAGTKMQKDA